MKRNACALFLLCWILPAAKSQSTQDPHHFIALFVTNLDSTVKWYEQKLGFTIIDRKEVAAANIKAAIMSYNDLLVEVIQHPKSVTSNQVKEKFPDNIGTQGFFKLGIYQENLDALEASLKSKGVKIRYPVLTADGFSKKLRLFIIEDPEGNMVQFYHYIK